MCVDGQQRLTTTLILLASLRDAALLVGTDGTALANDIDAALFHSATHARAWTAEVAASVVQCEASPPPP